MSQTLSDKKWRKRNPEKTRLYRQRWKAKNPEKYAKHVQHQIARMKLPENAEKRRVYVRNYSYQMKREVFDAYGGKCSCCGESQIEFLTIDHIEGRGVYFRSQKYLDTLSEECKNKRTVVRGSNLEFYRFLKKMGFPKEDYRLFCMNCNWAHGKWGYCPHKSASVVGR